MVVADERVVLRRSWIYRRGCMRREGSKGRSI
jgi:hypothetical protein